MTMGIEYVYIFWLAVLGGIMGSFFNVCVYRIPRSMSLIHPGSLCPVCQVPIKFYDNIPLISYIILRGRCRSCGCTISLRYPLIETLSVVIIVVNFIQFDFSFEFVYYTFFLWLMLIIAFIDYEHLIIPDSLSIAGVIIGFGGAFFARHESMLWVFLGGIITGVVLLFIKFFSRILFHKESLGMGDVKLGIVVGAFMGWEMALLSLYFSFVLVFLYGLGLIVKERQFPNQKFPLGSFIALGTGIGIFWGEALLRFYIEQLSGI